MLRRTRPARAVVAAGLALVVAGGLAGCGSDDGKDAGDKASPSPSESSTGPASYLPVPEGVTLTEPGTALALGEEGVIAFERRQDEIGVLSVVVERIERTSFQESFPGWNVDDTTAARTPYFVRLKVTNAGDTDLGGLRLDNVLWADDGNNLEAPNYYTAAQLPACDGAALPTPFATAATAELCQVYFIAPAHSFESVSFPPYGGLDAVTWSGPISKVTKPAKPGKGGKGGKKGGAKPSGSATPSGSASPSGSATPSSSATGSPSAS
ncbi:hypothetical protein BJ993_000268 [Nocardioides aromaticivorans]|uniref:DUF4352 domain-containing protein n=1 Tax=Nocardioides aromaticivorans TaxID=200618 RepID=A0A7Y9ZER8_9ACTN|nr:hypothetical protein [Nocardioides aromaticivorans]NYI43188.1 hypothetical protein [Nocardioides aromaticivorans]